MTFVARLKRARRAFVAPQAQRPAEWSPWAELKRLDDERYVRLDSRFGRCPVCRDHATAVSPEADHVVAICGPCSSRWVVPEVRMVVVIEREWVDAIMRQPKDCNRYAQ